MSRVVVAAAPTRTSAPTTNLETATDFSRGRRPSWALGHLRHHQCSGRWWSSLACAATSNGSGPRSRTCERANKNRFVGGFQIDATSTGRRSECLASDCDNCDLKCPKWPQTPLAAPPNMIAFALVDRRDAGAAARDNPRSRLWAVAQRHRAVVCRETDQTPSRRVVAVSRRRSLASQTPGPINNSISRSRKPRAAPKERTDSKRAVRTARARAPRPHLSWRRRRASRRSVVPTTTAS